MTEANGLLVVACIGWGLVGYLGSRLRRALKEIQQVKSHNLEMHTAVIEQGLTIQKLNERPIVTNATGATTHPSEVVIPPQVGEAL